MTEQHSQLINYVKKFMGSVRFGNDHFVPIMGYGDYQIGNVTISRVYYVERHGHNLLSVGKTGQKFVYNLTRRYIEFSLICLLSKASKTKSWLWHRCLSHLNFGTINQLAKEGLVKDKSYYQDVRITHQTLVARTPQQNNIIERRNLTLVEVARTMLMFSKASFFLWAKVVETACYTQNRSLIRTRHNKTPYELMHDHKPDLKYLHVFGGLCYPTNNSEDLGKLKPKNDIGLVPNLVSSTPYVPPSKKD
ncbi:integrase, catalytic region, zinc finger, CCHC-type containing protein [Tanacetum coccineum]